MNWKLHIVVVGALLTALPYKLLGADEPPETPTSSSQPAVAEHTAFSLSESLDDFLSNASYSGCDACVSDCETGCDGDTCYTPLLAARFGWWGVSTDGSLNKVGEYQDLKSGAFWDVDGLSSDGYSTFDFNASGLDNESSDIGLNYFQPNFSSKVHYNRFLHRLDHDPLNGLIHGPGRDAPWIGRIEDFNVGEDFAIRVSKLDARFKGSVSENVKWRVNLWGMRKVGERQGRALNHNCADHECHIRAQRQTIDWLTMEIEPVIEVRLSENTTIEYSRTMRSFEQSDGVVTRPYPSSPTRFVDGTAQHPYAVVPENFTQIDRIKLGSRLNDDTRLYAMAYIGDTENKNRETNRQFGGYDVRITNSSLEGVTVTGYAKYYESNNEKPSFNPEVNDFTSGTFNPDPVLGHDPNRSDDPRFPVDRRKTTAGVKGRWRPFERSRTGAKMSFGGGYEYKQIDRDHVIYDITAAGESFIGPGDIFMQPTTVSNSVFVDATMDWCSTVKSYVRYTMRETRNPLFGVRENTEASDETPGAEIAAREFALNTNQPEHENHIEFGGTWMPTYNFMLNATVGILMSDHRSAYADFSEDSYPATISASYAASDCWTIHGGLAFFSNWIEQESTIGIDHLSGRGNDFAENLALNYTGRAQVINLGTRYDWTDRLTTSVLMEFVRAENNISDPSIPGQDLSLMPRTFDVLIETLRVNVGVDYLLSDAVSCYFRYNHYDWNDMSGNPGSGTADMFLGGVAATY